MKIASLKRMYPEGTMMCSFRDEDDRFYYCIGDDAKVMESSKITERKLEKVGRFIFLRVPKYLVDTLLNAGAKRFIIVNL